MQGLLNECNLGLFSVNHVNHVHQLIKKSTPVNKLDRPIILSQVVVVTHVVCSVFFV